MRSTIISDTSCLILLDKIGQLDLLHKLFGSIITTQEVSDEFGAALPRWIIIKSPSNKEYQLTIETLVDKGEASAIALAVEYEDCLLIIDDLKGRKLALKLGISITGTFGIIIDAKLKGILPLVKPLIEKIRQTDFYVSEALEAIILEKAGE